MERSVDKAWGIGLGRTGTTTICEAFRILGYKKVIHNPKFEELATIDAAADNGCTIFYKYLAFRFPESKFVLTTRDLRSWLESFRYISDEHPIDKHSPERYELAIQRRMLLYETVDFDEHKMTDAYYRHHEDVRRFFKNTPDRLLEFNITAGEGWEKLCPFLGREIPNVPFPRKNIRSMPLVSEKTK
jgi:hypothetical protein